MNENKVVIGTILSISDKRVEITCEEWGNIVIERGKNWDGGVYWEGFTRKLNPGDKVDLYRSYMNSMATKPSYGFYTLGSLISSPARENKQSVSINKYFKTESGKKVQNFINQTTQDAVVRFVRESNGKKIVTCYSPVWKTLDIDITYNSSIYVRRGDVISVYRVRDDNTNNFNYFVRENKTEQEIVDRGIQKILKGFNPEERTAIITISEYQRKIQR